MPALRRGSQRMSRPALRPIMSDLLKPMPSMTSASRHGFSSTIFIEAAPKRLMIFWISASRRPNSARNVTSLGCPIMLV
ncbi:hypothetical protein D3C71_2156580 [compost metagenome]